MRLRLLISLGVALALAGFVGFTRLQAYVKEDARFCASCHQASPEFAIWSGGQHGGVTCQKCHHASTEESLVMLRSFLGGARPAQHAPFEIGACASCHLSHDKEWVTVGASRGHRVHAVEQKIACVKCHGGGVHRFEPPVASCQGCHGAHAINVPRMQKLHCLACHDFLSVETTLRPTRRDCLRCHRELGVHPSLFPDDAPMRFACAGCHKPHAPPGDERVSCESCHTALAGAGLHRLPAHRDCVQCHRPHLWKSACADCQGCHHGMTLLTCASDRPWRAPATPAPSRRGK